MTYDEFIAAHKGKGVDYDGTAGVQCVDLVKCYLKEVFGISPGSWGNAHCYYDNFENISALKNNFTRIANTADFVPQKGDIGVWGTSLSSSGYGHVAICTGEGSKTYFYSYDQNWTGNHDVCARVKHTYKAFLGVLRPKTATTTTAASAAVSSVDAAKSQSKSLTGTYKTTANLHLRTGAGTSKQSLAVIPKGKTVQNYGYYTTANGVKWLYVAYGDLTGFCCSTYLKKQ